MKDWNGVPWWIAEYQCWKGFKTGFGQVSVENGGATVDTALRHKRKTRWALKGPSSSVVLCFPNRAKCFHTIRYCHPKCEWLRTYHHSSVARQIKWHFVYSVQVYCQEFSNLFQHEKKEARANSYVCIPF